MSIVPRLTYYSTARLYSVLQVPHAVMNRLFPMNSSCPASLTQASEE
jgi:hypothetical protein